MPEARLLGGDGDLQAVRMVVVMPPLFSGRIADRVIIFIHNMTKRIQKQEVMVKMTQKGCHFDDSSEKGCEMI